ncbi:hypothetical protein EYZ11_002024 [Aspergillus tanneri]|uniref:Phospholipase D n=1 Tax=Aspergillus tanneri TaxID=1220188 RepID=A0A4S3JS21_9EURO|nr:uncharacterized protein ATNIH1004_004380 [Aspergillus tanneri]KAA8648495.1 hypothetical protein ATNIH1004_004380 [Aspergillus tanneri]THC98516.1 hypothetical protein EYZ11_002024 [Aspergillus tanneri]
MVHLSPLLCAFRALYIISLIGSVASYIKPAQRPIYAIAHRVLRTEGLQAAISHGANALEVDLTAWYNGWWADHDGSIFRYGDPARKLFDEIAQQRQQGHDITFVWLDIKDPDYCRRGACSIEALRDLVRETLEPAGVRVLYGFFETEQSRGYKIIRDSLNSNEAIALSGRANAVLEWYENTGASIPVNQRIMDYGATQLNYDIGSCYEDRYYTCTELKQGSKARDQGKLGKVFGWTSAAGDLMLLHHLLEVGGDGMIYGFGANEYKDDRRTKYAFQEITWIVSNHSDTLRMATANDAPW